MFSAVEPSLYVKKRERTQNWVPEEKSALFELVKVHVHAIENKKLDAVSAAQKSNAWNKIYQDFRGIFSTERDNDKIKAQWTRMKAQARLELYTFAAQVKVIGLEQASRRMPSKSSIAVWRLLQSLKKSDYEVGDNSDESSQDADATSELDAILEKLPIFDNSEVTSFSPVIKTEPLCEGFDDHFINGSSVYSEQRSTENISRKRKSGLDGIDNSYQSMYMEQKKSRGESSRMQYYENSANEEKDQDHDEVMTENAMPPEDIYQHETTDDFASWRLEAVKKEHELKVQMLNTELDRASLQKQAAINDLRTSTIRRQMAQAQADEYYSQTLMSGQPGSGAGKGGGGGGSIRSAGGTFGKMEAAQEDQYFYNKQKEQLKNLREGLHDEISFHEEQIKRHQEAIDRHNERIGKMPES